MSFFFKHETAIIDKNVKVGSGTKIWHWTHISKGAKIGKNCTIGQNVFIGNNVIIGNDVKIQNNVSIYEGVILENKVFCGPSVVFTNVKYPVANKKISKNKYTKTIVKKSATLGANSTIICGIKIGENSLVGAGSVVTKNVNNHAVIIGNPAIEIGKRCLCNKIAKKPFKKKHKCVRCNYKFL
jgi:UDP-2-acetamido-3-amino-2,3-dideoxy-glucuronate N-acetyltransferase